MTAKKWVKTFVALSAGLMILTGAMVAVIDPFFHYHKPLDGFFYKLDDERYQNDGITKNFEYDAVITGTSMTQNFKTSQAEDLFGQKFIKVCFSGAKFKEINDNLEVAVKTHDVKMVIRGIDGTYLLEDENSMRTDLGTYPDYLYDSNIFNDVKYLLNMDVLMKYCFPMMAKRCMGADSGVTSFDDYSNWMEEAVFGTVDMPVKENVDVIGMEKALTSREKKTLTDSIEQNAVKIARENPDTQFYYFFPPYSRAYWNMRIDEGQIVRDFECYKLAAKLMVQCPNIHLFAFDDMFNITCDPANYRDVTHYGDWINELILNSMKNQTNELKSSTIEQYYDNVLTKLLGQNSK